MHANLYLILAMASSIWAGMENLPSGEYDAVISPDGESIELFLVGGSGAVDKSSPLVFHAVEQDDAKTAPTLEKRWSGGCHGPGLDTGSTDIVLAQLKAWAGRGTELCSYSSTNAKYFTNGNIMAYYCVNERGKCGNLDTVDVDYAMQQMDQWCGAYQGSWFNWAGSPEIVGKGAIGTSVCLGW
ncbi:hypothetical protein NLU13_9152 [Sarocladium strictum]|uniref:Uncharacterized protein n=1 Tax=Sarocladium strictum TaxID=5046 RepID=A0AA39L458_SARSR|nr:hypothetical protein NLU13_9152 [Sarocladium strictum]